MDDEGASSVTLRGMECLGCGATTTNGLALCDLCRRKVSTDLEFLPIYFRNLSRWRPGKAGGTRVFQSTVLWDGIPEGTGDRVRDALDEASNVLTTWARSLADSQPILRRPLEFFDAVIMGEASVLDLDEAQVAALLSRGFDRNLDTISTKDWAGQFVYDISMQESALRELTEAAIPGWYAGACNMCDNATHVVHGLTWVTCIHCGSTTYVRDRLPVILKEARGWVARPREIAEAMVALLDDETDVPRLYNRIRQWASREQLIPVDSWDYDPRLGYARDYDSDRAYRYRLADVLDLREAMKQQARADALAS